MRETERSPVYGPERRCLPRYVPGCRLDSGRQGVQERIDRSDRRRVTASQGAGCRTR